MIFFFHSLFFAYCNTYSIKWVKSPGLSRLPMKIGFELAIKGVGEVFFFNKQTHAHKEKERGWWGWLVNLAPSISFKRIPYPIHHITKPNVPFLSNNTYLWSQVFFPLITSRFFLGGIFHLLRKKYIYFTWNKLTLKAQFFIDDVDKFFEFSRSDGYYNVNSAQFLRKKKILLDFLILPNLVMIREICILLIK